MDKEKNYNNDCIPSYLKFLPNSNKIKLPTKLNKSDSSHWLKISDNGLKIVYEGLENYIKRVGAIRANYHAPYEIKLFYYEIDVIFGSVGLGFCESNIQLERMPGWDPLSYGYHGDDGNKFTNSLDKKYGPVFTTGDTVGVGINFFNHTIFFTKNGIHLGTAFTDVTSKSLYPMIGMKNLKECVVVNFGQKQFTFDIDQYARKLIFEYNNQLHLLQ